MLVVDVSINRRHYIGRLCIQRVKGNIGEPCEYKVKEPAGYEDEIITHHYNDGWLMLLSRVVKLIEERR